MRPYRTLLAALASIAVVTTTQAAAIGQIPDSQAAQKLSGGSSRRWIIKPLAGFLGPGSHCSGGDTYTFFADYKVRHDECMSHSIRETNLTWRVLPQANQENIIEIGQQEYEIRFKEDERSVYARLRPIVPQGVEVKDITLRYAKPEI